MKPAIGVRMALARGRGRSAVPLWSTVAGGVLAVLTVVAAAGFGSSLDHLLATPRLYGVNWTVTAGDDFSPDLRSSIVPALRRDPGVAAFAGGTFANFELDHRVHVHALATQSLQGNVTPTVLEGHAPTSPEEILLGTTTLDNLGKHVGSTVVAQRGSTRVRLRIVGRGVLPDFGEGGLGSGAALTYDAWRRLAPEAPENYFLVRYVPGANMSQVSRRLELAINQPGVINHRASTPTDLINFGRVDNTPSIAAALIVLMATAALVHTLISQVQHQRRDVAVLKTLGFVRRQVLAITAWQATTLAAVALIVGLPLGVATGRIAWRVFADQLGVVTEPRFAWPAIAVTIPTALLLANLIAALPARAAARTQPAVVLRSQ